MTPAAPTDDTKQEPFRWVRHVRGRVHHRTCRVVRWAGDGSLPAEPFHRWLWPEAPVGVPQDMRPITTDSELWDAIEAVGADDWLSPCPPLGSESIPRSRSMPDPTSGEGREAVTPLTYLQAERTIKDTLSTYGNWDRGTQAHHILRAIGYDSLLAALDRREGEGELRDALQQVSGDMHNTSRRPCATCRAATKALGAPFGCYAFQERLKAEAGVATAALSPTPNPTEP